MDRSNRGKDRASVLPDLALVPALPGGRKTRQRSQPIPVPTAIVPGDRDEAIKRDRAEYMASVIPSARPIVLKDVSHFAMLQDPEGYTEAILAFLANSVAARSRRCRYRAATGAGRAFFEKGGRVCQLARRWRRTRNQKKNDVVTACEAMGVQAGSTWLKS